MARLLGLVAKEPVELRMSLAEAPEEFTRLGQNNPDGWGLGYFTEGRAAVTKQDLPARGPIPPGQTAASACSTIFVAHVRRSSRAPRAVKNTHPFFYGDWMFAHTGALYPLLEVNVRRWAGRQRTYEGQTDSEALFQLLISYLERATEPIAAIEEAVRPILADGQFSGLNFILANSETLYAFRYAARSADYYSLFWRNREPGAALDARSRDNFARFESPELARTPSVLVCSEQIEQAEWHALEMGELLVVQQADLSTQTVKLL